MICFESNQTFDSYESILLLDLINLRVMENLLSRWYMSESILVVKMALKDRRPARVFVLLPPIELLQEEG